MPNSELSEKMSEAGVDTEPLTLLYQTGKSKDKIAEDRKTHKPKYLLTTYYVMNVKHTQKNQYLPDTSPYLSQQ